MGSIVAPAFRKQAGKITLLPLIAATYLVVSGGPFGLEDIVSKAGYLGSILILLVTPFIWSLPTALMVSELASALPQEGGFYVWVTRAMGPFWGFQEVWLSLVGSMFDMAIYPTLFVSYLGHFNPDLTAGSRGHWIGVALIAAAALWNLLGAKTVGGSSVLLGILLLAPFVALMTYPLTHHATPAWHAVPLRQVDILGGILVAMWNYMGWDNVSTVANDVQTPQRTYPLAMGGTVLLVALSYLLPVSAVAMSGLDPNQWSTGGWADVARGVFHNGTAGMILAVAITIGGMVGAVGTLNAWVLVLARLPVVLAEDGFLPKSLAWRSSRTGAPWVAIAACSAAWALCLGFSFVKLILLDVLLTGLSVLLEFVALVVLRVREPDLPRPYRVPGGLPGAVALGIPPVFLLILTAVRNDIEPVGPINALEFGAILIGLGVLAYFFGDRYRKHDHR